MKKLRFVVVTGAALAGLGVMGQAAMAAPGDGAGQCVAANVREWRAAGNSPAQEAKERGHASAGQLMRTVRAVCNEGLETPHE